MPLVSLDRISIAYGHLPLLDGTSLQLEPGERVSLIGRNGAGKSTLLRILAGQVTPDSGSVWRQPGVRVALLEQDVPLAAHRAVFDVVAEGLGDLRDVITAYHHAAHQMAEGGSDDVLQTLGRLQHELEERDGWRLEQRVEVVLDRLQLPSETIVDTLSGGWRRRVLLARALVAQPELLLLDEPTNHLDIDAITWLEGFLADYPGAVMFVTHDRAFLQRLATRIVEIDRGQLASWPGGYDTYLRRKEEALGNEATQQEKFDKKLADEEVWLRQGVKARRTRNEGRVKALIAMRAERAARREQMGDVRLQVEKADPSGKLVFEARHISKSFTADPAAVESGPVSPAAPPVGPVVCDFSTRVMRGDRIGLIGPNGAGKTTLLRLLLGEIRPDRGEVRHGANVQIAYYDQQREQLDPERSVFDTVGEGNDTVTVSGHSRHVNGYLRDFLFPPERARSPVKSLSGGERNRLLLARLFTRPANVLVLDEPTNDLDLETLELLEAQLVEWPGTLLLVSHDRAFLDNVVTSTFVFEGAGRVQEYVGGYEDWVRQRPDAGGGKASSERDARPPRAKPSDERSAPPRKKLSYNEQRELAELPARIDALETEQRLLTAQISAPEFYREGGDAIGAALARAASLSRELASVYARWDELESLR
jgi:ATP-binding cassette subfamily F protein uup